MCPTLHARNFIKSLGGGETQPQLFECSDDQEWVLKLPGNPHLGGGLCADWLGTKVATLLDVPTVECDLAEVGSAALSTIREDVPARAWAKPGIAFASLFVRDFEDVNSATMVLDHAAPGSLARTVVVDTWFDVLDRQKPIGWNLLLDKRRGTTRLVVIDYGLGLQEVVGSIPILGPPSAVVLRVPSSWRPYLARPDVDQAVSAVENFPTQEIAALTQMVPTAWTSGAPKWSSVVQYLDSRRHQLRTAFKAGGLL